MPFIARCPYCGQRSRVPESSEGSSGQCPRCGAFYTLVPEEEVPQSSAVVASAPPPEPEPPLAGVARVVLPGTFIQPSGPTTGGVARTGAARGAGVWLAGVGAVGLLLTSVAMLAASFPAVVRLVLPLSAVALLLGLAGLWWGVMLGQGKRSLLLPAIASVAAATLFSVASIWPALLGPTFEASRVRRIDPNAMQVVPLPNNRGLENASPDWVDASKAALRQGGTLVKIARVWIGPAAPAGKKAVGKKTDAGKEAHLFIRLQVFRPGGSDAPPAPSARPRLMDAAGSVYEFRAHIGAPAEKPAASGTRTPLGSEEVFAFAPPAAAVNSLRLEVPAERWAAAGFFHFTIPATMIEGGQR
ncbi:MAG: hypothetical protein FJ271_16925 [Planctomycetes bacterium]|nr:hypothetical protein [Planctomycetota bacterium]